MEPNANAQRTNSIQDRRRLKGTTANMGRDNLNGQGALRGRGAKNKESLKFKNNLQEKEDLAFSKQNKIALIFWALINNNIISSNVYAGILFLDYLFQVLLILCVYDEFNAFPADMNGFDDIVDLNTLENSQFIQDLAIFLYCFIMIAAFLVLLFKNSREEHHNEKNMFLKALSLMFALMRSVLLTFFLVSLSSNISDFNSVMYLRYLEIFFLIGSFLQISVITYCQAYFFNITVPNSMLPWSETQPHTLIFDNIYKLMLGLTFNFKEDIAFRFTFTVVCIAILAYKFVVRIFTSYMFNKVVCVVNMIGDGIVLFLLVIMLPAQIFEQEIYFFYMLAILVCFLFLLAYIYRRFKIEWTLRNSEGVDNETQRMNGYLTLLAFYGEEDCHMSRNYLSQIHYSHQLKCSSYYKRLDKRLTKKYTKLHSKGDAHRDYNDEDADEKQGLRGQSKGKSSNQIGIESAFNQESTIYNYMGNESSSMRFASANVNQSYITALGQGVTFQADEEEGKEEDCSADARPGKGQSEPDGPAHRAASETLPYLTENENDLKSVLSSQFQARKKFMFQSNEEVMKSNSGTKANQTVMSRKMQMFREANSKAEKLRGQMQKKRSTLKSGTAWPYNKSNTTTSSIFNDQEILHESASHYNSQLPYLHKNEETIAHHSQKRRAKTHKNLLKHLFKHHFSTERAKDYKLQILKIYFTIKVLNNNLLAHFLLFNFITHLDQENIKTRTIKLIHQKYFETTLNFKNSQEDELLKQLDLQKMLDLNQLFANFEEQLEQVADLIHKFWSCLINEKDTEQLYGKGITISEGLKTIQKTYYDIEQKQGDQKEMKIFMLMGVFYKLVVFKNDEYMQEIQKSRHAHQTRKLARDHKELSGEKGLLIADLSLKKPMEVSFANKAMSKMLDYQQTEMVGLKVNTFMPQLIAENHHKFIDKFMVTGKNGMLGRRLPLLMRTRSNYLKPVVLFLNVNHLNVRNMILLVEETDQYDKPPTQDQEEGALVQSGYLLCDFSTRVMELTRNLKQICGLTNKIVRLYLQNEGNNAKLEDLFVFGVSDLQVSLQQGVSEFFVRIKYEHLLASVSQNDLDGQGFQTVNSNSFLKQATQSLQNSQEPIQKQTLMAGGMMRSFANQNEIAWIMNQTFTLKLKQLSYLDGILKLFVVQIQPMQTSQDDGLQYAQRYLLKYQGDRSQATNSGLVNRQGLDKEKGQLGGFQSLNGVKQNMSREQAGFSSTDHEQIEEFDLSSQTSTNSSSSSSLMSKFSHYNNNVNSQKIPGTLKFVLQIVLVVIMLMIAASTVTVVLTANNFNDASLSIDVCNQALQRLNSLSTTRVVIRTLFNIAQGYIPNSNDLVKDQFHAFSDILDQVLEDMRINQLTLDKLDLSVANSLGEVELQFMTINSQIITDSRYISQAVMIYTDYGFSLIKTADEKGRGALKSQNTYFIIENTNIPKATEVERNGFFLIQNSNQDLYYYNQLYANTYNALKEEEIDSKITFQGWMTWICIGIVFLCLAIIIPLFGRIQYRVQYLMRIFFNLEKAKKIDMMKRVHKFQRIVAQTSQNQVQVDEGSIDIDEPLVSDDGQIDGKQDSKLEPSSKKTGQQLGQSKFKISNRDSRADRKTKKQKLQVEGEEEDDEEIKDQDNDGNGEEQDDQDGESRKRSSKKDRKKKKREQREQEEQSMAVANKILMASSIEQEFNRMVKSSLIKQSLGIFTIGLCLSAYFLGTYFLSQRDFTELTKSIDVLFTLFYRQTCVENVVHSIVETIIFNEQLFINKGQDEIMSYYQEFCYSTENNYQQWILKERPEYLKDAYEFLDLLESGNYCDTLFADNTKTPLSYRITPQQCKTYANGLATTGLTNIFQTAYKQTNQIKILIDNFNETQEQNDLPKEFALQQFALMPPLLNIIEIILGQSLNDLNDLAILSVKNNISQKKLIFLLIYSLFIALTILILVFFLFNIFRKLKREMLLSNRLLYIIDFQATTEQQKVDITKFLTHY